MSKDSSEDKSDIKSTVMKNKGLIFVCIIGGLILIGAMGIAFLNYYDKPLPESISEILVSAIAEVEEEIPTILVAGEEVTVEGPPIVLYNNHNLSCTVIAGVITDEVERGAAKRGCSYLEMPFIDDAYLCNGVTRSCEFMLISEL